MAPRKLKRQAFRLNIVIEARVSNTTVFQNTIAYPDFPLVLGCLSYINVVSRFTIKTDKMSVASSELDAHAPRHVSPHIHPFCPLAFRCGANSPHN
jgi:hypothetical protein